MELESSFISIFYCRETLRVGKSRHWRDVIRVLTKGQTDRLSAESMLKYFQPLELWLKVQNREEKVIGWNILQDDTALFRPVELNAADLIFKRMFQFMLIFILSLHLYI